MILAPTLPSMYCPECGHRPGVHDPERGCTMPSEWPSRDSCRCKESDAYKADRLSRIVEVKQNALLAAQREYTAHIAVMLAKTEEKPS